MNSFNDYNRDTGDIFADLLHDPEESFLFGANDLHLEEVEEQKGVDDL